MRSGDVRISCFALDALRLADPEEPLPRHKRGVVVIAKAVAPKSCCRGGGRVVVAADDGLSVDEVADAIRATDAAHVVVMANGELASQELVAVAAQARSTHRSVVFIPTLSMVQCLSALAVHDPGEECRRRRLRDGRGRRGYPLGVGAAGVRAGDDPGRDQRAGRHARLHRSALVIGHDPWPRRPPCSTSCWPPAAS